jgi:hypothetical protein
MEPSRPPWEIISAECTSFPAEREKAVLVSGIFNGVVEVASLCVWVTLDDFELREEFIVLVLWIFLRSPSCDRVGLRARECILAEIFCGATGRVAWHRAREIL